jgi:hypothetical protein
MAALTNWFQKGLSWLHGLIGGDINSNDETCSPRFQDAIQSSAVLRFVFHDKIFRCPLHSRIGLVKGLSRDEERFLFQF